MNKRLLAAFADHAKACYPQECCGLLVKKGRATQYWPCTNVATAPEDEFTISTEDYAAAEDAGEVLAVCHSHPDATSQASPRDKAMCNAADIPWHILSWPEGDLRTITPEDMPLIGRRWVHGTDQDCYGLIRAWYKQEHGIELPRFEHDFYWWEAEHSADLYLQHYQEAGFSEVTDGSLEVGDVILMQIRATKVNHGAIYLGNGTMLHHPFGKLSLTEAYAGYWQERTRLVVRYKM